MIMSNQVYKTVIFKQEEFGFIQNEQKKNSYSINSLENYYFAKIFKH